MSGIGWEETLPVELWMDRETGQVTATLPRDRWLKALELGLDREPAPLAVILARALLEEAEAESECPRPLAEIAAAAGAFIDAAVAALEGETEIEGFEA